jgi:hypothetical protein
MLPSVLGASFSKIEQPVQIFSNERLKSIKQNGSPISLTIEPVIKARVTNPPRDYIAVRHHRFFKELDAIHRNEAVSEDIDDALLEDFRNLAAGGLHATFSQYFAKLGHYLLVTYGKQSREEQNSRSLSTLDAQFILLFQLSNPCRPCRLEALEEFFPFQESP